MNRGFIRPRPFNGAIETVLRRRFELVLDGRFFFKKNDLRVGSSRNLTDIEPLDGYRTEDKCAASDSYQLYVMGHVMHFPIIGEQRPAGF